MVHMHADPVRDADRRGDAEARAIELRIEAHERIVREFIRALSESPIFPVSCFDTVRGNHERAVIDVVGELLDADDDWQLLRLLLEVATRAADRGDLPAQALIKSLAERHAAGMVEQLESEGAL